MFTGAADRKLQYATIKLFSFLPSALKREKEKLNYRNNKFYLTTASLERMPTLGVPPTHTYTHTHV